MTTSEEYGRISPAGGKRNMGRTSTEVKRRWNDKTYKRVAVYFRVDSAEDRKILDYIETNKDTIGTTQIFREAIEMYMKANNK